MKKINILLTLAAVLISLNGFSQKIEDVERKRNDIMALKGGEYELINVSIPSPQSTFGGAQAYKVDSEIVCMFHTRLEWLGEKHFISYSYKSYYENNELIYIDFIKETFNNRNNTRDFRKEFYFSNGELFAATNYVTGDKKPKKIKNLDDEVEEYDLIDYDKEIMDKCWKEYKKTKK